MPIIQSAVKRMRQTAKRHDRNLIDKREMKAAVKTLSLAPSLESLRKAQSAIDKAVKKNLLDKNTAARRKSNLVKIAKQAGVKMPSGVKKATAAPKQASKPVKSAAPKATVKKPAKPAAKSTKSVKPATKSVTKSPAKAKKQA